MKIDSSMPINATAASDAKSQSDVEELKAFEEIFNQLKSDGDLDALKETTEEFESLFINMMFQAMRKTIQDGGLIEKSQATEIFESMLDEELSAEMASAGGIGLAEKMFDQLKQTYENEETTKSLDLKG